MLRLWFGITLLFLVSGNDNGFGVNYEEAKE